MKTTIGRFDAATRTVAVTFSHNDVAHERQVNACLSADGKYDTKATKLRVEEVARGVEHKIDLGVIGTPPSDQALQSVPREE